MPTAILNRTFATLFAIAATVEFGCAASSRTSATTRPTVDLAAMRPAPPRIPERTFSVADFGAIGDGVADDAPAIQRAIDACGAAGGGTVRVPAGRYLIGPVRLASRIELRVDRGATLLGRDDVAAYPTAPSPYFKNDVRFTDLITADFCSDVAITGEGTIDGQGQAWWREYYRHRRPPGSTQWVAGPIAFPHRPNLIVLSGCDRVRVSGVTLMNGPMFHLIPQQCRDVTIEGLTIRAPSGAPNTDGIDPSGRRIRIVNCDIETGDDNVVFKPQYPPTFPRPADANDHFACEDLYVGDCRFGRGHGLSIGGQTNDGLRRLLAERIAFDGTNVGVRLKAERGTGGAVEDCTFRDLTLKNVGTALLVTSYYPSLPADPATMPAKPRDAKTPTYRNVRFERVTATGCTEAGGLVGLAEAPIEGVALDDVSIEAKRAMRIVDAHGVRFERSTITPGVVATRSDVSGIAVGPWTGAIAPIDKNGAPATRP